MGPFLGYKIMIDAGFTFDVPARLRAHQRARAVGHGATAGGKTVIPLLNLNVGWSF